MGFFTPLVFGTNRGMRVECQMFLRNLTEKLSRKNGELYAAVITWLRRRLSFEILRSVHISVRNAFCKANEFLDDFSLNINGAGVFTN